MVTETDLDPATLRAIAKTTDDRAEFYRGQCKCSLHLALMNYSLQLAAELRSRAIRIEQARETARRAAVASPTRELPVVVSRMPQHGGPVPEGMTVERVPRSEVVRGTRGMPAIPPFAGVATGHAIKAAAEHEHYEQAVRAINGNVDRYRELLRVTGLPPRDAYRRVLYETLSADE